jgi:hypothetical protein
MCGVPMSRRAYDADFASSGAIKGSRHATTARLPALNLSVGGYLHQSSRPSKRLSEMSDESTHRSCVESLEHWVARLKRALSYHGMKLRQSLSGGCTSDRQRSSIINSFCSRYRQDGIRWWASQWLVAPSSRKAILPRASFNSFVLFGDRFAGFDIFTTEDQGGHGSQNQLRNRTRRHADDREIDNPHIARLSSLNARRPEYGVSGTKGRSTTLPTIVPNNYPPTSAYRSSCLAWFDKHLSKLTCSLARI